MYFADNIDVAVKSENNVNRLSSRVDEVLSRGYNIEINISKQRV